MTSLKKVSQRPSNRAGADPRFSSRYGRCFCRGLLALAVATLAWANARLQANEAGAATTAFGSLASRANPRAVHQDSSDRESAAVSNRDEEAEVESLLHSVSTPDAAALRNALGAATVKESDGLSDTASPSLLELSGPAVGGVPEFVLKWVNNPSRVSNTADDASSPAMWSLIFISWDGKQWRAAQIRAGFEPFSFKILSSPIDGPTKIALVVYGGDVAIPYPAVFELKDNTVKLLWDGKSDDSRYEGYALGQIDFQAARGDGLPDMVSRGRADPGIIVFPRANQRGFEARTRYEWRGGAYIPIKTEYEANEDYALYRFIAALHLRDFPTAYGLIAPTQFLKSDKPNLKMFQTLIEGSWQEFLHDNIFQALDVKSGSADPHAFELATENETYLYNPTFSADSKHLLTGLSRRTVVRQAQ